MINSRHAFFCCSSDVTSEQGISQSLHPANLPISLSICLSIVLVYSTYPPVSVLVRFSNILVTTFFSDTWDRFNCSPFGKLLFVLHVKTKRRISQPLLARHLKAQSLRLKTFHTSSRPNLKRILERTGILTGYPSTTPPLIGASC